jgi:hypothetical protein
MMVDRASDKSAIKNIVSTVRIRVERWFFNIFVTRICIAYFRNLKHAPTSLAWLHRGVLEIGLDGES